MSKQIAVRFVEARRTARTLAAYPGAAPRSMAEAYAIQDAAIALWPDRVAGWKVGLVPLPYRESMGTDRLLGPIFAGSIERAGGAPVRMPVFADGFAAVEAEFIIEVGADADPAKRDYTPGEAAKLVAAIRIGIEPAGSPFAQINDHGPAVTASDFGNNNGLILGAKIGDWRGRTPDSYTCETWIDGSLVGTGTAASVPGGPLAAFAFALGMLATRGRALKRGDLVTTGAATGIHEISVGQSARVLFDGIGEVACHAVARTPQD